MLIANGFSIPQNLAPASPYVPPELKAYLHDFKYLAGLSTVLVPAKIDVPPNFYGEYGFKVPDDCDFIIQGVRFSAMPFGVKKGVTFRLTDAQTGRQLFGNAKDSQGMPVELSAGYLRDGFHMREEIPLLHWQKRNSTILFRFDNSNKFPVTGEAVLSCLAIYKSQQGVL